VLTRIAIASALFITPLAWSMANENTALVKTLAAAIFAFSVGIDPDWWKPGNRGRTGWNATLIPILLFASVFVPSLFSPSPSFTRQAWWPVSIFFLLFLVASCPQSPRFWRYAVVLSAILPITHGLLQSLGIDPTSWAAVAREHFHGRICATLGNPNFLAAFLAGVIPFLAWNTLQAVSKAGRMVAGTFALAAVVGLLFTGSKGGLIGLVAAALGLFAGMWRGRLFPSATGRPAVNILAGGCVGALVVLAVIIALMPAALRQRILLAGPEGAWAGGATAVARNESVRFRILTWKQTLKMTRESPVTGLGLGRYQVVYPRYRLPEIIGMFGQHSYMTDHPENLTLEIMSELGLIGLGTWFWLVVCTIRILRWKQARPDFTTRWLAAACAGSLAGIFATNSFGVDIHYGATAALAACVLGAALSFGKTTCMTKQNDNMILASKIMMPIALILAIILGPIRMYMSDAALARAIASSSSGSWDTAIRYYDQAMNYRWPNIIARYFGASALLDRGRVEDLPEARRLLEGVKAEATDYVLVNFKLWLLYNRLGLKAEAQKSLERQIELDPLAAVFYLERGRLAFDEKRWEDAKRDFETATRMEPNNPSGWQYLGNLMASKGMFAEAIRIYEAGLSRTPDAEELNYNAAFAAYKLGDRKRARAFAAAALRKNPGNASASLIYSRTR